MQAVEQPQHVQRRGTIEVPRGLVGQDGERVVGERPGDRHPLTLASGQRRRQERGPVSQPDLLQQAGRPPPGRLRRVPGQQRRQFDVLRSGQLIHQVESLEHKADQVAAQPGQSLLAHPVDAVPGQVQFAAGRPVQPAQQVQQR